MTTKTALALLAALLLCSYVGPARGQQFTGARAVPLGYCQLTTLSSSSALASCSGGIPAGATSARIVAEAQAVRYRDDGTAPTSGVGMPLATGEALDYSGTLSALRFIEQTSGGKLNVSFYR